MADLRNNPYRRWQERGWLILMRARHKRFLARSTGWMNRLGWRRGWTVWSIGCRRRHGLSAVLADSSEASDLLEGTEDTTGRGTGSGLDARGENNFDEQLQLLEAGSACSSFAWAVMTVVEIEEEGLFRNIVAYL